MNLTPSPIFSPTATAAKVLDLTEKLVEEGSLTTLMITHNLKDAIRCGNRLIMMNEGQIILDIEGEAKKNLTKRELMDRFESDRMLLS